MLNKISEKSNRELKAGIVLSYALILLNAAYGLFFTPYILRQIGADEFGVYKTISSLSSALMVLDLGIGSTVMRYVAGFRANGDKEKIPDFMAMSFIQGAFLCLGVIFAGLILLSSLDVIYSDTFTVIELGKARGLFIILLINMVLHVIENVINGAITGFNRFTFGNGIKVLRLAVRVAAVSVLLQFIPDSYVLAITDLSVTLCFSALEYLYLRRKLGVKPVLSRWDNHLFREAGKYTFFMLLTSLAVQFNNNLDNIIIGALKGPRLVTVYSFGLIIFAMYENLSTAVSGVMLPTVSKILASDKSGLRIEKLIVSAGRLQFALLGAAVVGFACLGKQFIKLWLGEDFSDVYIISLILMISSLFELCVNVCLSILRAKNMLGFRTAVLSFSTLLNALITVAAVKYWSYIGAALGTAASFIVGSVIIMNIYYCRKLKLPMLKIYGKIFSRIWICLLAAAVVLIISARYINGGWTAFILNVLIFCIVYGAALIFCGLNKEELKRLPLISVFIK